jgi:antitoxin ParD1/3/4
MHVNLTPTLDEYVLAKVKSGRYNNASEVVREALRRMQDDEARSSGTWDFTPDEMDEIRKNVQQGIDELDRGEGTTYEGARGLKQFFREIEAQGRKELAAERKKKAKR